MTFFKTAQVHVLGSWTGDAPTKSIRTASGSPRTASYYLQNAGRVNIEAALKEVSDAYQISDRVADYIFTPVRANSVDVPNENGDGFSKEESLRFDHKIGRRVYQTYLYKPHHVNHRADNPRMARGVIVDVHYNDQNPMPEAWRKKYEASTGNTIPRDLFVETLLAVDRHKDPHFTRGMQAGVLNAFSMGCDCERTRCNVCAHVASSKQEFCPHIRGGNKLKWFPRPSDGKRVQAFEWCEGVVYGELSAVDQPADPRALRGADVFQLHAALEEKGFSARERLEILAFAKRFAGKLPGGVEKALESVMGDLFSL